MQKYNGKYRIQSTRLQNWDYGDNALYFITICTQNRRCWFGNVVDLDNNPTMELSEIGKIVESEWLTTFELRKDMNLDQGEFVVMPNHFHAIIGIGDNIFNGTDAMHRVSTAKNRFGPQSKNLASIVRGFKSAVTMTARKLHIDFQWQSLYHDHIIRNDRSFQRITQYIIDNPAKWAQDTFHATPKSI